MEKAVTNFNSGGRGADRRCFGGAGRPILELGKLQYGGG